PQLLQRRQQARAEKQGPPKVLPTAAMTEGERQAVLAKRKRMKEAVELARLSPPASPSIPPANAEPSHLASGMQQLAPDVTFDRYEVRSGERHAPINLLRTRSQTLTVDPPADYLPSGVVSMSNVPLMSLVTGADLSSGQQETFGSALF